MPQVTIINIKDGEVSYSNFETVTAGQVLLKNCSETFINNLINAVRGEVHAQATVSDYRNISSPAAETTHTTAETGCCGGKNCKNRPSEQEVEVAIKKLNKPKKTQKDIKDEAALSVELAELVTESDALIEALTENVQADDTNLNPEEVKVKQSDIEAALLLWALFGMNDFVLGDVKDLDITSNQIDRLARKLRILDVAGKLAATKYSVSLQFVEELFETLAETDRELYRQVDELTDKLHSLTEAQD